MVSKEYNLSFYNVDGALGFDRVPIGGRGVIQSSDKITAMGVAGYNIAITALLGDANLQMRVSASKA
jgi:hypothetical protein